MIADILCEKIKAKKNPCIVGLDPEWHKMPECYKSFSPAEGIYRWACDIIDTASPTVPAVKPQMAFYEVFGHSGVEVFEKIVKYAHKKGLLVIDDSKRNDIGNTSRAYAFAHLSKDGPINADFLTISPFLGEDSMEPFFECALENDKGLFILVKTSNPDSKNIQDAVRKDGKKVCVSLSEYVYRRGTEYIKHSGYSSIGAVVGATFPKTAQELRRIMKNNFFLVPGYGAQGGTADSIVHCFNPDGLGALISSSREITYKHLIADNFDGSKNAYLEIVEKQTKKMQSEVYSALNRNFQNMEY